MIAWIISSSVLIIVVIAMRFLFRGKISRRLQYALWGLVLIRLLMPFSLFGSALSVMNAVDTSQITDSISDIQVYSDIIRDTEMFPDEAQSVENGTLHEIQGYPVESGISHLKSYIFTDSLNVVLLRILRIVWLTGSTIVGLWFAGVNLFLYLRLRKTREAHIVVDSKLPVYIAQNLASPCLFGILNPSIYLTPKAVTSEDSTRFVLAHELCHYHHGDHIWSITRGLCLAAWWWNPLVWAAAIFSRADSELACDEAVIKQIGKDNRLIYGRMLIDMIAVKTAKTSLVCTATTISSGKRGFKERLNMIIKNPKTFIPAMVAVILIVAVSVICTFTGAQVNKNQTTGNEAVYSYAQELYDCRNPYIGDTPSDVDLLTTLGVSEKLGSYMLELETKKEPYVLRLMFANEVADSVAFNSAMNKSAMLLLALIDNVSEIQWQYNYSDPVADGYGIFTSSLTIEDATSALNGTDIKSYGKSPAEVQTLLNWLDTDNTHVEYTLIKLGEDDEIHYTYNPLSGDDAQLAEDIILNYRTKSAAWPGVEFTSLDEYYLLRATYSDGMSTDYYSYLLDGKAVMQRGTDGYYRRIDDILYEKLVKLMHSGTTIVDGVDEPDTADMSIDRTNLDNCIADAILTANMSQYHNGDFTTEAHTILKTIESGNTTTVYAMALYQAYGYAGGGFEETGGSHMPVAITFEKNTEGEYALKEYWMPQDGSYYASSLKEKFPSDIYEDALDTQKYIIVQIQACYENAIQYGNVDVDSEIARLIETISSSPAQMSNPLAYIQEHPLEYRKLIYYGNHTLGYCFTLFDQGGQTGLEGHIMASACRDILGEAEGNDLLANTGQDWYDAFRTATPY